MLKPSLLQQLKEELAAAVRERIRSAFGALH